MGADADERFNTMGTEDPWDAHPARQMLGLGLQRAGFGRHHDIRHTAFWAKRSPGTWEDHRLAINLRHDKTSPRSTTPRCRSSPNSGGERSSRRQTAWTKAGCLPLSGMQVYAPMDLRLACT